MRKTVILKSAMWIRNAWKKICGGPVSYTHLDVYKRQGVKPPLFSFKVNSRPLMHFSYARYMENKIREAFGFEGTSIKFVFREKGEKEDE